RHCGRSAAGSAGRKGGDRDNSNRLRRCFRSGQSPAEAPALMPASWDRLPELASELVRLKVDVIVALYVPCALAAKGATREIPIVIVAADPVETGIVASLARPGGNITGVSLMSAVLIGKCVELFRDMLATTRRVALLTNAA